MSLNSPKRNRGFILSLQGWEKLQARRNQIEKDTGHKLSQQALIRQIQLIDAQGLHPITLRKIMGRQVGVDERSLRLVFQAMKLELAPLDYKLASLKEEIEPDQPIQATPLPLAQSLPIAPAATVPDFPGGTIPLESPFYIESERQLTSAYQEISRPGGLVRIKAPQKSGKSSFALRLQHHAETLGYKTLRVDFQQADEELFSSFDRFLRWFCTTLSYQLDLPSTIQEHWNEEAGSKVSCTIYLQKVLLKPLPSPVVLVLNEVNRLFEYPVIYQEFLPLLRSWYQEAKCHPVLQKLRFVLIYSTEIYVSLHLNQSPFNIGLPVELRDLTLEEIQRLAILYELPEAVALPLRDLVGGRSYLIQLGLYYLSHHAISLEQFVDEAATPSGIYVNHLNECLATLQQDPELTEAFKQVLENKNPVPLNPIVAYKLERLGLIKLDGYNAMPSCKLYQQFFAAVLCQLAPFQGQKASSDSSSTVYSATVYQFHAK
ncbi:AAA-like domain-containing protein [Egbenema bharatensis]|uniref:AAA-like domain-containing protein n=1 Tax=Egbenema bharatensis TaxID=3463334 RepID=UPI003A8A5B8E